MTSDAATWARKLEEIRREWARITAISSGSSRNDAASEWAFDYADDLLVQLTLHAQAVAAERENLCWEPGHTQMILMGDGSEETRRLPRVHCVACTDAAMAQAERAENEACERAAQGILDACDCVNVAARESAKRHIDVIVDRIRARREGRG